REEPGYSVGEHHLAPAITGVALRRSSNWVLSGGLYRGPRTSSLRNKAVCKDAVCSFVYRRARSPQLIDAMPSSTGPPQPTTCLQRTVLANRIGRCDDWRGGARSGISVGRAFRFAVPH